MSIGLTSLAVPRRVPTFVGTAAAFAIGVLGASTVGPLLSARAPTTTPLASAGSRPARAPVPAVGYPADVLRVIDGDTFEARVRVWPGLDITTKVRLRGIDAPELHARCPDERVKAKAARDALRALLEAGGVRISGVSLDKYGGRVVASASTTEIASISEALFARGRVRHYSGGRRQSWCPEHSR